MTRTLEGDASSERVEGSIEAGLADTARVSSKGVEGGYPRVLNQDSGSSSRGGGGRLEEECFWGHGRVMKVERRCGWGGE